jgi:hypothetical protein
MMARMMMIEMTIINSSSVNPAARDARRGEAAATLRRKAADKE